MKGISRSAAAGFFTGLVVIVAGCGSGSSSNNPLSAFPPATTPLVRLSTDTFSNPSSQHATEVEPDSFAFVRTARSAMRR